MNETDTIRLQGKLSRLRSWVLWGAIAVLVGLIMEVWLAFAFHKGEGFWETYGSVIATGLIALGVLAETIFGHKGDAVSGALQALAEQRTAEANARAAEANLQVERLKAEFRPRVLTLAQREKLKELQNHLSEAVVIWSPDAESAGFAWQIRRALEDSGIMVTSPVKSSVAAGLFAFFPDDMNPYQQEKLSSILSGAGMTYKRRSSLSRDDISDISKELIVIFVGEKELAYDTPP